MSFFRDFYFFFVPLRGCTCCNSDSVTNRTLPIKLNLTTKTDDLQSKKLVFLIFSALFFKHLFVYLFKLSNYYTEKFFAKSYVFGICYLFTFFYVIKFGYFIQYHPFDYRKLFLFDQNEHKAWSTVQCFDSTYHFDSDLLCFKFF